MHQYARAAGEQVVRPSPSRGLRAAVTDNRPSACRERTSAVQYALASGRHKRQMAVLIIDMLLSSGGMRA